MSLWSNDGQVDEAPLVGLQVALRRTDNNGGPAHPFDPAPLQAALEAFVADSADVDCWTTPDGVYWHAELRWTGGLGWSPVAYFTPEALGRDLAAFASWAARVAEWVRSKPVPDAPPTRVQLLATYGKAWVVPLDDRKPAEPVAAPDRCTQVVG